MCLNNVVTKIKNASLQLAAESHAWAGLPQPSWQSAIVAPSSYWNCGKFEVEFGVTNLPRAADRSLLSCAQVRDIFWCPAMSNIIVCTECVLTRAPSAAACAVAMRPHDEVSK